MPHQPASSVSGRGGAESQDRMRDSSASSSMTDLYCTPHSSRSDLFLLSTAGDFSLSASLSACTLLNEVPEKRGHSCGFRKPWGVSERELSFNYSLTVNVCTKTDYLKNE
uniref:Uncharacterized protein n=1 Tax=Gopherus agassizii TaxID=38772 RepID=A0A452IBU3_9SAUR